MSVAVIHLGARLHYAVPAALQQAGLLRIMYTDAQAATFYGLLLRQVERIYPVPAVKRLCSRKVPEIIPKNKLRSWLWPSLQPELFKRRYRDRATLARSYWENGVGGHWLSQRAIADNFGNANVLYVHPCVSTDAIMAAKSRGIFVVLEAISHPLNKLVEMREYEKFGISHPESEATMKDNIEFFKMEALMADLVLAASPYVKQGLVDLGIDENKIKLVPYGFQSDRFSSPANPIQKRVLFVGNVGYLKGVTYLAEAARILQQRGVDCEFRVVGPASPSLTHRAEFQGVNYIGSLPRNEVHKEFLSADVFVFPTLSDGFGIVQLEAMAAGLPLIATQDCGAVVEDGVNGFVVPPRNAVALANRIMQVITDRELRQRLSHGARLRSKEFTMRNYSDTLCAQIIESVAAKAPQNSC